MNALKQAVARQGVRPMQLSHTAEIAVFAHFKAASMKIQVCQVRPGEVPNHLQLIFTRGAFAWVRILSGKRLEFRFQKSTMLTHTMLQHFGYGQFQVTQSMILPRTLAHRLNLTSHWIKAGMYLVTETAEELIVTF